jgi:hypothetical protein
LSGGATKLLLIRPRAGQIDESVRSATSNGGRLYTCDDAARPVVQAGLVNAPAPQLPADGPVDDEVTGRECIANGVLSAAWVLSGLGHCRPPVEYAITMVSDGRWVCFGRKILPVADVRIRGLNHRHVAVRELNAAAERVGQLVYERAGLTFVDSKDCGSLSKGVNGLRSTYRDRLRSCGCDLTPDRPGVTTDPIP